MKKIFFLIAIFLISLSGNTFGQVGIQTSSPNPKSVLDVVSKNNDKGVLLPRLTKVQIDAMTPGLTSTEDGLTVYNTTEKCFNLWKQNKWQSICGDKASSVFVVDDCSGASVQGSYVKGTALSGSNTYTIKVNVTQVGPYTIVGNTGNGYSFSKTGLFTNTGQQTLVLDGSGTPVAASPASGDVVTFTFNGVTASVSCTLPTVTVVGNDAVMTIDCNNTTVFGNYKYPNVPTNSSNYIDVPVTVSTAGVVLIETNTVNGIRFSSGPIAVSTATTFIKLYAQGTPAGLGTFTYNFSFGANSCNIPVTVRDALGTPQAPAARCFNILSENPSAVDGEYYIQGKNGAAVKTYCDMTNGGLTMIRSLSEKSAFNDSNIFATQNLDYQGEVNYDAAVSTAPGGGIINYKAYFLPLADPIASPTPSESVRQNAANSVSHNLYRVRIVQDAAHLHDNNDSWANNNYAFIDFSTANEGDLIFGLGTDSTPILKITGKVFGKSYTTNGTHTGNYVSFSGQSWNYVNIINMSAAGSSSGLANTKSSPNPAVTPPAYAFSYTNSDGSTTTNDVANMGFLFGIGTTGGTLNYAPNHHFGKCRVTDTPGGAIVSEDFQGLKRCNAGYQNRTPHSFNAGEGRYMQWFVK